MRDEDKWPTMHAYRTAVAHGDAPAITCPECNGELVPVVGKDLDPELKCYSCGIVFDIGLSTWDQIEKSIRELNVTVDFDIKEFE